MTIDKRNYWKENIIVRVNPTLTKQDARRKEKS